MSRRISPLLRGTVSLAALAVVAVLCTPNGFAKDKAGKAEPRLQAAYCFDCHECANPTEDDPCLKRCPEIHPGRKAKRHSPEECPEEIVIDRLSDLYGPVFFAHKLHAEMGEMGLGCDLCHHYSPAGEMPPCRQCHGGQANPQNLRQPGLKGAYHRQCLNCHREWSHNTACEACHVQKRPGVPLQQDANGSDIVGIDHPAVVPVPTYVYKTSYEDGSLVTFHHTDHSELFGLKCASCHRQENCSRCHDIGPRTPHVRQDPFEDCSRCHSDELDRDCAFCHSDTPKEPFHHARRTDFVLEVFHLEVECRSCHDAGDRFIGLDPNCGSCHEAGWIPEGFNHKRTGIELDETHVELDCQDCHIEGIGQPASCQACHDDEIQSFPPREG